MKRTFCLFVNENAPRGRFAEWNQFYEDEKMTVALLDRLTHKAQILEFVDELYRFRQRI